MATGTVTIKDRCRLCYTRLKDPNSSHHKFWCARENHRIYNIYHRRPIRYRDLIVRYLYIQLPEHDPSDQYSRLLCGNCAAALNKLDQAYRTFQQTQRLLRSKYRKTSHIVHYQLDQQRLKNVTNNETTKESEEKVSLPKRQSKRKGEPKHIDQTMNSTRKTSLNNGMALPILTEKREHSRAKPMVDENPKKKFRVETSNEEIPNCVNLLKPTIPIEISSTKNVLSLNKKTGKSTKGNHIERIAVSLLSGTETLSDIGNTKSTLSNGSDNHPPTKARPSRKGPTTFEVTTTNNILSPIIRSPVIGDDIDDDQVSLGGASNSSSMEVTTESNLIDGTKQTSSPSTISTTATAEGLAITAINPTGQKQVFMAKQLGNLKKYQCSLCEKIVTNIQIHVRRHTNDKPYPCTYCEKRFTNSGDLQIHVRIHTGEKPYACPLCLKSYRTIGNFNSHVKTHDSGTRPHRCELCDQVFPIPKDWYSHLRSSHRSRTANLESNNNSSAVTIPTTKTSSTINKPIVNNRLSSEMKQESILPNPMKLEPIHRSQLLIKSSSAENRSESENEDEDEPVNMSKRIEDEDDDDEEENINGENDDDDDDVEEKPSEKSSSSTKNLLRKVSKSTSSVHV